MNATRLLFDELEAAVADSDLGRRAQILRRIADLFASASGNLSAEQISLFDDIMHELVKEVETGARVWFAERLTRDPASLPRTLRDLALDDEIDHQGDSDAAVVGGGIGRRSRRVAWSVLAAEAADGPEGSRVLSIARAVA